VGTLALSRWDREFADSPLEESGFEPLVPLTTETLFRTPIRPPPGRKRLKSGPAQKGMRSHQPFERLLRSGDIAICWRTGIAHV
jgi:hypothetical protein